MSDMTVTGAALALKNEPGLSHFVILLFFKAVLKPDYTV